MSHCLKKKKKKKKCGGGFLRVSLHEIPVSSWLSPKPKYASPKLHYSPDIDKLCPPLLFSFSLSNYWTRKRWTKAVHRDYPAKKKKSCSQRLNKNHRGKVSIHESHIIHIRSIQIYNRKNIRARRGCENGKALRHNV